MAAFSAVASRVGNLEKGYAYFRETARLDLDDTHGNTRDGLHMANMAGAWVCMASGFGGMTVTAQGIAFDPRLPAQLRGYGFRAAYQGGSLRCGWTPGPPLRADLRPAPDHPRPGPGNHPAINHYDTSPRDKEVYIHALPRHHF